MKDLMRRRPAVVGGILVAAVLALALGLGWIRPKGAAERYKEELIARGEVLDLKKLIPRQSKEAVEFHETLGQLASGLRNRPITLAAMGWRSGVTNGYSIPLWAAGRPDEKHSWAELTEQLDFNRTNVVEIRRLLTHPPSGTRAPDGGYFGFGGMLKAVEGKRSTTVGLAAETVNALRARRLADAQVNLRALFDLSRIEDPATYLVELMVRVSIFDIGQSVAWQALQMPDWTEQELLLLKASIESNRFLPALPRVVQLERAAIVAAFAASETNGRGPIFVLGIRTGGPRIVDRAYDSLYLSLWSDADQARYLEGAQTIIEETRTTIASTNWRALYLAWSNRSFRAEAPMGWFDRWRYPVSKTSSPSWGRAVSAILKIETRRDQALAAIALHRFLLSHGRLPQSVNELVPEHLSRWPDDSFGNGSLIYRRIDDRRFVLLSPGEDGREDAGAGDDIVWPAVRELPPASSPDQ